VSTQSEIRFSFEKAPSVLFSVIHRPVALVHIYAKQLRIWIPVWGIVDTGADYTLLPKGYAQRLGIDLRKDCKVFKTTGVGGQQKSYILREGKIKIGSFERTIPIGFLEKSDIPPLLGRQGLLETFELIFKDMRRFLEIYNHKDEVLDIFRENQQ